MDHENDGPLEIKTINLHAREYVVSFVAHEMVVNPLRLVGVVTYEETGGCL